MSKMDQLRALREAKYAKATTQARPRAAAPVAPTKAPPVRAEAPVSAADPAEAAQSGEQPCGHRSMNGRTCTREQGHAAKSHRYS